MAAAATATAVAAAAAMHQAPTVEGGLCICVYVDTINGPLLIHLVIIILWDGVLCCCCWHVNRPTAICCCCSVIRPRDGASVLSTCFVYEPWHLRAGRRAERCLFREQLLLHRFWPWGEGSQAIRRKCMLKTVTD